MREKHEFKIVDDLVALYLLRCGKTPLSPEVERLGALLGMGGPSLRMRVGNMKYLEAVGGKWAPQKERKPGPGLKNYANQSCEVYRHSSGLSCEDLRTRIDQYRPGLGL